MRLDDYPEKDGKRVWLTVDEIERLTGTDEVDGPETQAGRAG